MILGGGQQNKACKGLLFGLKLRAVLATLGAVHSQGGKPGPLCTAPPLSFEIYKPMPASPATQAASAPIATDLFGATRWITAAATQHGAALCSHVVARLGTSRSSAHTLLRKLVAAQWLVRDGTPQHPVYRPGALRQVVQTYPLASMLSPQTLWAQALWAQDFAPCFDVAPALQEAARLAFAELLHNAQLHSQGSRVTVSLRQTPQQLQLLVSDDGCGLFAQAQQPPQEALASITSAIGTCQGLQACALLADVLDVQANGQASGQAGGQAFQHRAWEQTPGATPLWRQGRLPTGHNRRGSSVYLAISLGSADERPNLQTAVTMLAGCAQRASTRLAGTDPSSHLADLEHVGAAGVTHGLAAGDGVGVAGAQHAQLYQKGLGLGQGLVAVA